MRPNVLLITVDQWRGDCLGVLGHPVVKTPNLDALAARGVLFHNHFSQCAPCGPSRASIHTGLYMHSHRSVDNGTPLDDRFTNMAKEARALGYDPTVFGYTDTTLDPRTLEPGDPALRSYESVLPGYTTGVQIDTEQEPWLDWLEGHGYDISVGRQELHHPGGARYGPPTYAAEHTDTAFMTEKMIELVDAFEADRGDESDAPGWFVHASYLRPHPPFVVPEPYNSMFDPSNMPPPNRRPTVDEETAIHGLMRGFIASGQGADADPETVARWQAVYFGMMAEVDAQLGRLFDAIDLDNTVIILSSDHGEQLGDHWLSGKLGFYPESFHIPMIVAGPGVTASGSTVDRFTENVDLFPTVMDLVDGETPHQCQGWSLVPFLRGEDPDDWRNAAHWEWDFRAYGAEGGDPEQRNLCVLHDENGTYVHFAGGRPLFFDLTDDPEHFVDRSSDPDRTSRVMGYTQRMLTWRLRTDFGELVNINQETGPRSG